VCVHTYIHAHIYIYIYIFKYITYMYIEGSSGGATGQTPLHSGQRSCEASLQGLHVCVCI